MVSCRGERGCYFDIQIKFLWLGGDNAKSKAAMTTPRDMLSIRSEDKLYFNIY